MENKKWVNVKISAHRNVLLSVLAFGFIQGAFFGFGLTYLLFVL
jgi:hypothetical protein